MLDFLRAKRDPAMERMARRLAACVRVADVVAALCDCARPVIGADGLTIIQREGDEVVYVSEDAISPLWAGRRFPMRSCISGLAIMTRTPIVIPDILLDKRVPLNAYLSTFVRSMTVVPIGHVDPAMAMGAYWREPQPVPPDTVLAMQAVATLAADTLARIDGQPVVERQVA